MIKLLNKICDNSSIYGPILVIGLVVCLGMSFLVWRYSGFETDNFYLETNYSAYGADICIRREIVFGYDNFILCGDIRDIERIKSEMYKIRNSLLKAKSDVEK